jgi:hypothetical protein
MRNIAPDPGTCPRDTADTLAGTGFFMRSGACRKRHGRRTVRATGTLRHRCPHLSFPERITITIIGLVRRVAVSGYHATSAGRPRFRRGSVAGALALAWAGTKLNDVAR